MANAEVTELKSMALAIAKDVGYDYVGLITEAFPSYNTAKKKQRIRNVKNGVLADKTILKYLMFIAGQRKAMVAGLKTV